MKGRRAAALAFATLCLWAAGAGAHSASDAYLDLTVTQSGRQAGPTLHGQWDIALRDLDFVLTLDDDGDGRLTWREVRRHRADIARYAFAHLRIAGKAAAVCRLEPGAQMIDAHADGAYAALFFDVRCAHEARSLGLDYDLFFAIDPSHRAILVLRDGEQTSTALLAPRNARIELPL